MKISVSGGQFFADGFAVRGAFCMEEGERRLLSYVAESGCGCAEAKVTNGNLTVGGDCFELIRWKTQAELRPAAHSSHREVATQEVANGDARFLVECVTKPRSTLRVLGDAEASWRTSVPLFSPYLSLIEGQKQSIVRLSADCAQGKYIAILSLAKGSARLLLEDYGDSVTCRGNEVIVARRYPDLRARVVTATYLWQGDGFLPSRNVVCSKDHPFIREDMGRLLIESVITRDEDAMKGLLSHEAMDASAIFDYFGEVTEVASSRAAPTDTAVSVIKKEGNHLVGATYDFDFDAAGRIENIRCLDE